MTRAKSLKGNTGSVRQVRHVKGTSVALTVGLDRHLRVFDHKTNEELPSFYLKNKLNCLFPYEVNIKEESEDDEDIDEDGEDSELMEEGEFDEEDDECNDEEEEEDDNEDEEEEVLNKKKKSKNKK